MNSDKQFIDFSTEVMLKSICEEKNIEISYIKSGSNDTVKLQATHRNILSWNQLRNFQSLIKSIFLPKGFPDSVSNDYLEYQIWDTCQAFCSSISGMLSMSAVMKGVGVGSQTATPVSAAITWIMKDGTGMIGSIIFTWSKGSKLDSDCKKWRLFADVLNDAAMCLELYLPYVMQYSMFILCLSTTMKALVGVAGSATRAALTCHQAISGNMADVSAKDGSQEIFVNLFAYLIGIFLLNHVTESDKIWTVMCTFILLHLFFNYKALSSLKINVYNGERFRLSLRSFLATSDVPTVVHVNRNESVFLGRGTTNIGIFGFNIHLGVSLESAVVLQRLTPDDLSFLVVLFQSRNYILTPYVKHREILVSFRRNYKDIDVLKGYFHAILAAIAIKVATQNETLPVLRRRRNNSPVFRLTKILREYNSSKKSGLYQSKCLPVQALLSCEELIEREFALFCKLSLEQGWNLRKHLILVGEWTADWKYVDGKRTPSSPENLSRSIFLPSYQRQTDHNVQEVTQREPRRSQKVNAKKYVNYMGL